MVARYTRIHPQTLGLARSLRRAQTEAESTLWARLRDRQADGLRFRRQHPIGPYVADFYCPEAHLVVEIDGDTHVGNERHDAVRSQYLAERGYRVIRFWNSDVHENIDGVLEAIWIECGRKARAVAISSPLRERIKVRVKVTCFHERSV